MREFGVAALEGRQEGGSVMFSDLCISLLLLPGLAWPYLAVDWSHGPDDWLGAVGKDGLVISNINCHSNSREINHFPTCPSH